MISDTAVARSARNGAKKDDRMSFFSAMWFLEKVGGVKLRASIMSVSFGCRCRRCAPAASRADADQRVSVNLAASGGRAVDRTDA